MNWLILIPLCIVGVTIGDAFAQEATQPPRPAPPAHIVRVRTESACGWCSGGNGYHETETIIEPGRFIIINRSDYDKKKYPDIESDYKITKRNWEDLQRAIDAKVLDAIDAFAKTPGCPGCADEPTGWIEVQFSDGTKKAVAYNQGGEPPQLLPLMQGISALLSKALQRPIPSPSP